MHAGNFGGCPQEIVGAVVHTGQGTVVHTGQGAADLAVLAGLYPDARAADKEKCRLPKKLEDRQS